MADTLRQRVEGLKNNRAPFYRMAIYDVLALLDDHCGDGCTHHAALKRCVEALEPFKNASIVNGQILGLMTEDFRRAKQTLAELKEIV